MAGATIRVKCQGCGSRLLTPARRAGLGVRCPKCKANVRVPVASEEPRRPEPSRYPRWRGTKRGSKRKAKKILLVCSIPIFILAVLSAAVTVFVGFFIPMVLMMQTGEFATYRVLMAVRLAIGTGITMSIFYVAECVLHGRFVGYHEAFTTQKGQ